MRMRAMKADDIEHSSRDSQEIAAVAKRGPVHWPSALAGKNNCRSKRRDSAVTFDLPDDSDDDERATISRCCVRRRMSAPELPPILDRSDSRGNRSSASTERHSLVQKFKNGFLPRNLSEGSFRGMLEKTTNSRSSSSVNSNTNAGYYSARTKSGCDTEKSNGSTTRLGTLFERKRSQEKSFTQRSSASGHKSTSTSNSKEHSKLDIDFKTNGHAEILPLDGIAGYANSRDISNNHLATSRRKHSLINNTIISAEKINNFTKSARKIGFLKRFNSTPNINKTGLFTPQNLEHHLNEKELTTNNDVKDSEKDRLSRIFEWLKGVEFLAEHPPEQVIEYIDEPLQTDTAVHIVYSED